MSWPLAIIHCATLPTAYQGKHQEWASVPGPYGFFRAPCLLSRPTHSPVTGTYSVLSGYTQILCQPAEAVVMNDYDFLEWNIYPWAVLTIWTNSQLQAAFSASDHHSGVTTLGHPFHYSVVSSPSFLGCPPGIYKHPQAWNWFLYMILQLHVGLHFWVGSWGILIN